MKSIFWYSIARSTTWSLTEIASGVTINLDIVTNYKDWGKQKAHISSRYQLTYNFQVYELKTKLIL
jgi:hypothetical protein